MPPTTRSGGKRTSGAAPPLAGSTRHPIVIVRKATNTKTAPTVATPMRCVLLELPAEIRNRIYHFCKEYEFSWDKPHPLRRANKAARWRRRPGRTFFSLTQTCSQTWTEYRPLWLRGSSVALDFDNLKDYLTTFHSQPGAQQLDVHNALKMMAIHWDHDRDPYKNGDLLLDLKSLLSFRAFCEWSTIYFESRQMAERDFPHEECETCNQCINCCGRCKLTDWKDVLKESLLSDAEDSEFEYDSDYLDEMFPIWDTCPHDDLLGEVEHDISEKYSYLNAFNCFLGNKNEAWLKSIRDDILGRTRIECNMGPKSKYPTIYIRFDKGHAPEIFTKKMLYLVTCQYLTNVGIIDLEERKMLDFVIGVATGKTTRHSTDCKTVIPTYNQITVLGRAYREPASIVRATKTGAAN